MSEERRNDSISDEQPIPPTTAEDTSLPTNEQPSNSTFLADEPKTIPAITPEPTRTPEIPQHNNPTPNYIPPQYNTGYYTSAPGQTPSGSMYSYPANQFEQQNNKTYAPPQPKAKPPKKEKRRIGIGTVIICLFISLLCGFGGAFGGLVFYGVLFGNFGNNADNTTNTNSSAVIYESVDREITDEIAKAGSVAAVAQIALPSVVEIRTEAVINNSFYGQYVTEGAGSGVIISSDGYIVTNNHVVNGSSSITVRLTNGDEHTAKIIGTDAQSDIAIIKINAKNLTAAVFGDSSKLVIGEPAIAIGNPLGELGGTVTDGIISALDRNVTIDGENMVLLQTNAAVSPGNSGGGLFNAQGDLIGIVNAKSSGSSIEGLGFAIPINTAKPIIADLIENGYVTGRPSIGISIIEITTDYQRYMYNVNDFGVYIQDSINSGLKAGDRIIAVDGNSISTTSDIRAIINNHAVGDKITITVTRKNKIVDVEVTLIDSAQNNVTG